jgi:CBS-domain-containing membrane protein
MTARSVMNQNPAVLRCTDKISLAADHIMAQRCRRLPVIDEEGRYVGVFGINCLLRLVLPQAVIIERGLETASFMKTTLSDLHRRFNEVKDEPITLGIKDDASTVAPDTPLVETLRVLYGHMGSLPVVDPDDGRLLGVVSYWDVGAAILAAEV